VRATPNGFPHTPIPEKGITKDAILATLAERKANDKDWRGGRVFSLVYSAGDEHHELLVDALGLYAAENGLNVLAFPSIGLLSHDLVRSTASLLGADDPRSGGQIDGFLTSGGTESLLQAVKTGRDVARHERGIARPTVICATSGHAALTKAADYFDVDLVRVPVDGGYLADPAAMEAAVDESTILLVGSAPSYPQGVVDPIEDLAAVALRHDLLFHVDACMGGFMLPFLARAGRFERLFDFRVEGVTSMSADLHKYGYATKGVSAVLYRTPELARHQVFATTDWLGGFYASTAMAGTRPAGPIAAAWASLMHLGLEGFTDLAVRTHDAALALRRGIEAIDGLAVRGDPSMTVLAFGAVDPERLDIFEVANVLATNGWYLDRQNGPDSLHATVQAGNAGSVDELVADLALAVQSVGSRRAADRSTSYATGD